MYSYNEVEPSTRNIIACDQEMITFLLNQKKILLKVVLLVYIWVVIEKLLSHLIRVKKKKVGFKTLELEATKEQAVTRALLPWGTTVCQINAIFVQV